jgi:hypothetical protein
MAIGKASDFVIYQEEFYGGQYEALTQMIDVFNAASNGVIRLVAQDLRGDYDKETFIKSVSGLVSRRDPNSVAAATDLALQMGENIGVKVHRKVGPAAQTLDAFRKVGSDARQLSFEIGRQVGEQKFKDMANTAIAAAEAAIANVAALNSDKSSATIDHSALVAALALYGDAAGRIRAWIMHSKPWFDLVAKSITDKVTNVADVAIFGAVVGTLNRPAIVTDAGALLEAGAPNKYPILGLTEDAVVVTESEQQEIYSELVTGLESLVVRIQGEYAYNLKIKGFAWDVTNGGKNPLDAAIATGTNWDKVVADDKNAAGVRLLVQ